MTRTTTLRLIVGITMFVGLASGTGSGFAASITASVPADNASKTAYTPIVFEGDTTGAGASHHAHVKVVRNEDIDGDGNNEQVEYFYSEALSLQGPEGGWTVTWPAMNTNVGVGQTKEFYWAAYLHNSGNTVVDTTATRQLNIYYPLPA